MKTYAYDIEVFPNLFTLTAINVEDIEEKLVFVLHDDMPASWSIPTSKISISINKPLDLVKFLTEEKWLVGFNSINYDNLICNRLLIDVNRGTKFKTIASITSDLYGISNHIISTQDIYNDEERRILRYYGVNYHSIDLFLLGYEKGERKSLKQTAINLKWHKIQDSPLSFSKPVKPDLLPTVLHYNDNDVLITIKLFHYLKNKIKLRFNISARYNINVINSNKSNIADKILNKYYAEFSGIPYSTFKDLRTFRPSINVSECISPKVKFKHTTFKAILDHFKKAVIKDTYKELQHKVKFDNISYSLGSGGLHSEDYPGIFNETDTTIIRDADVTSYYPFIVLNERVKPAHLTDDFFKIVEMIITKRVEAKRNKDTVQAETLKITANSGGFGKMGFEGYWMYDRKAMVTVTINGQLFLLMLIERLVEAGFKVISANTDGIVTIIPKDREEEYLDICKQWQKELGFNLEYTDYKLYVRRDVNNYFTYKHNGEIKAKGDFVKSLSIEKGYDMPIVAIALQNYYIENIPIMDTLLKHRDIYDFCKSQKMGNDFNAEYHYVDPETKEMKIQQLQKNNRYIVTTNGGSFVKVSKTIVNGVSQTKYINICSGEAVTLFNDYYKPKRFKDYRINYNYYRQKIQETIDAISCNSTNKKIIQQNLNQLKLF